ncbi:MAG: POTRA domain-containing protein, partial [Bryobacteraceae bacterium]
MTSSTIVTAGTAWAFAVLFGITAIWPFALRGQEPPLIEEALQYEGLRIVNIVFEPVSQPLRDDELRKKLPFTAGSTFHERDLRVAIQSLFATGRFSDLAVDASEAEGGVALRFITQRAYFVGRVVVAGVKAPPNSGELASTTRLRLGTSYSDAEKEQALESLKATLRQNGYYHASVAVEVEYRPETEQADITFRAATGKRARFERPAITGNAEVPEETIVRVSHWKRLYGLLGWQEATESRVRQGLNNVRHYYEKKDLLQSKVTLTALNYEAEKNTVKPLIDIQPGPKVIIRVAGARIGEGTLRQLVPVY